MKTTLPLSILLGAVTCLFAGCSSSADPDGSEASDTELRRRPKATETWANLTVQLPSGSCQPGGSCSRPLGAKATVRLDGQVIALGGAQRIKAGEHTLSVNGVGTKITMTAGTNRTVVLPTARRQCTTAALPSVPSVDFGSGVLLSHPQCPDLAAPSNRTVEVWSDRSINIYWGGDCTDGQVGMLSGQNGWIKRIGGTLLRFEGQNGWSIGNDVCRNMEFGRRNYSAHVNGYCTPLYSEEDCVRQMRTLLDVDAQLRDSDLAFVPGNYSVSVGKGTQSFTLNEGDTSEIAISLPVIGSVPSSFLTEIAFTDPRELPDAGVATITSSCAGERTYAVPTASTTTLNLRAFQSPGCVYTLRAGGRAVTLSQTETNKITLNRLDVDDVAVTREDGLTYTVKGTYEVYYGGALVAGPFNTNTGLDFLPGTYELVIKFSTADGPQVQRETIAL